MLTKGDLVRIPQNTYIKPVADSWKLTITSKPQYGIVLDVRDTKCTVLFDDNRWLVNSKDLQLYGGKSVCKAS